MSLNAQTRPAEDIPLQDIKDLFPDYQVLQTFLEPKDVGHRGIRRRRTFIFMRHLERAEYIYDLYDFMDMIKEKLSKAVCTHPSDYVITDNAGQQLETADMARKRKIPHEPVTELCFQPDLVF